MTLSVYMYRSFRANFTLTLRCDVNSGRKWEFSTMAKSLLLLLFARSAVDEKQHMAKHEPGVPKLSLISESNSHTT